MHFAFWGRWGSMWRLRRFLGGGDSLQALGQLGFYTMWRLGCFFGGGFSAGFRTVGVLHYVVFRAFLLGGFFAGFRTVGVLHYMAFRAFSGVLRRLWDSWGSTLCGV